MLTPAATNGCAYTYPSTPRENSRLKVFEPTLAGVRIVSLVFAPVRMLSLWYVSTLTCPWLPDAEPRTATISKILTNFFIDSLSSLFFDLRHRKEDINSGSAQIEKVVP